MVDIERLKREAKHGDPTALAHLIVHLDRVRDPLLLRFVIGASWFIDPNHTAASWSALLQGAFHGPNGYYENSMWLGLKRAANSHLSDIGHWNQSKEDPIETPTVQGSITDMAALARYLVNQPWFEWAPGMRCRESGMTICETDNCDDWPEEGSTPDLHDPATCGVLWALLHSAVFEGLAHHFKTDEHLVSMHRAGSGFWSLCIYLRPTIEVEAWTQGELIVRALLHMHRKPTSPVQDRMFSRQNPWQDLNV